LQLAIESQTRIQSASGVDAGVMMRLMAVVVLLIPLVPMACCG